MLNPATDSARAQHDPLRDLGLEPDHDPDLRDPQRHIPGLPHRLGRHHLASFDIRLEGALVRSGYQSGTGGRWERLGPWPATLSDGTPRPHRRPRRQPLRDRALADRHPAATQLPTDGRVDRPRRGGELRPGDTDRPRRDRRRHRRTGQQGRVLRRPDKARRRHQRSLHAQLGDRQPRNPPAHRPRHRQPRRKHHLHEPHDHRHGHELPAAGRREGGDDHCGGWSRGRPRGNRRRELRADVRGDRVAEPRARSARSQLRHAHPEPRTGTPAA